MPYILTNIDRTKHKKRPIIEVVWARMLVILVAELLPYESFKENGSIGRFNHLVLILIYQLNSLIIGRFYIYSITCSFFIFFIQLRLYKVIICRLQNLMNY